MNNPYERETGIYDSVRPAYPEVLANRIISKARDNIEFSGEFPRIADIGAGTGKMAKMLIVRGAHVLAVEPSESMMTQLQELNSQSCQIYRATAEDTGLPTRSCEAAVFAQSWHWCETTAASRELKRILKPGATVHVVYNQLDVRVPWVKRLTRIMRSGDVHRPESKPSLGSSFSSPVRLDYYWNEKITFSNLLKLARTRSSYLKSSPENRIRMQRNLEWYLGEHLRIPLDAEIILPYLTYHWQAELTEV